VNIYKELENDIEGFQAPKHGYLMGWAKQGKLRHIFIGKFTRILS